MTQFSDAAKVRMFSDVCKKKRKNIAVVMIFYDLIGVCRVEAGVKQRKRGDARPSIIFGLIFIDNFECPTFYGY